MIMVDDGAPMFVFMMVTLGSHLGPQGWELNLLQVRVRWGKVVPKSEISSKLRQQQPYRGMISPYNPVVR